MSTVKRGKTALVLAGGGLTGVVYEVGALRAIDDLLVDRTVNDFDIYVGTSAGAVVTSLLANGVSPEDMIQTFRGDHPTIRSPESRDILKLNTGDLLRWAAGLPRGMLSIAQNYVNEPESLNIFELMWSLSELVPAGMYDGQSLGSYIREVLTAEGRTDSFTDLKTRSAHRRHGPKFGRAGCFQPARKLGRPHLTGGRRVDLFAAGIQAGRDRQQSLCGRGLARHGQPGYCT